MKLTLKTPGSKRLKLKYDELLPNVAFKFHLRRYIVVAGYTYSTTSTFGITVLSDSSNGYALVWKVSAEGSTLWAVRGGGAGIDYLQAVAVDSSGGVVVSRCRLNRRKPC